jgi:hypothetical protein
LVEVGMTKLLTKELNHCYACEFHYRENYNVGATMMCRVKEYKIIKPEEVDTIGKDFPLWCPLPNSAEIE